MKRVHRIETEPPPEPPAPATVQRVHGVELKLEPLEKRLAPTPTLPVFRR